MDWGIDYPGENPQDLVLYVWVDAPIEYISSTKQYSERVGADAFDWETAWKEGASDAHPEGGEIVHVIGRDIIQHHTIFWPAMLEATDHTEPRAVMASGFVTLGGKGFSTSRDRAVWADEYLDEGFHPDPLRYYLATNGGFQQDVDFSWEKFRDRVNTELVGTVGNFLYRSLLFAHRNYDDARPSRTRRATRSTSASRRSSPTSRPPSTTTPCARSATPSPTSRDTATSTSSAASRGSSSTTSPRGRAGHPRLRRDREGDRGPVRAHRSRRPSGSGTSSARTARSTRSPSRRSARAPRGDLAEPTELFEQIEDERVEALNEKLEARVAEAEDGDDESDEAADDDERAATTARATIPTTLTILTPLTT